MSAVLEPQAPAAVPANDDTVEVIDRAEINDGKALVAYSRTEAGLLALKEDLAGKVYDLATVKGNELARQDRQRCVSLRTSLEKKRLEFKRPVLDIGKMIDAEAKRITDEILKLEAPIDAAIKADEARREQIRQEKAAAEAARQQAHRDGIAKIRAYADAARRPDMTAERLLKGLSDLEAMVIDPAAWEEFATEAAHVLAETTAAVKSEHAAMVEREAESARLAQQAKEQAERKAELDRIAAEQKAQADALAAQQAEIARQAAELESQKRAAAAEAEAAKPAAPIQMQPAPSQAELIERGRMIVEDIITAEILRDSIPVGEAVDIEPESVAVLADDGKRWKLGDITALFGVGLTSDRVRGLGIEPIATEGRSLLFTTLQVVELRAALVAHLLGVEVA